MPTTTAQKLRIKEGFRLRTINAPDHFQNELGELPAGVQLSAKATAYDQVHWFVTSRAQLEKEVEAVIALLMDDVVCWIYYPKGSSGLQTDLTRDKGWEPLLKHTQLQWLSLISFNDTWSAFGMRLKTDDDKKKEAIPKQRPVFDYVDAATKTVRLPDDFAALLNGAPEEKAFFDALSFTNKKEWIEWIVSARRDDTRQTRIQESVERLKKRWKNPANR